jgi:hypothetical protein
MQPLGDLHIRHSLGRQPAKLISCFFAVHTPDSDSSEVFRSIRKFCNYGSLWVGKEKAPDRMAMRPGPKGLLYMKPNTDLALKNLPTEEVVRQYKDVESILLDEAFGNDHEARRNTMNERSTLFQELKRRGVRGY